jgi:hypothetical protein
MIITTIGTFPDEGTSVVMSFNMLDVRNCSIKHETCNINYTVLNFKAQ